MKKVIDVTNGSIQLSNGVVLDKTFSFEAFKKTKFYQEQDETKVITLSPVQEIGGQEFVITIRFMNGLLDHVSLVSTADFSDKDEPLRKVHHDKLLQDWQIKCGEYDWGRIESDYDRRGNISSINIFYE